MKWIFYTLVAANIAYFGWQFTRAEVIQQTQGRAKMAGSRLMLVSEQRGESIRDIEVQHVLSNPVSAPEEPVEEEVPEEEGMCKRLGPFDDVLTAQDVAERFTSVGYAVLLRAVDVPTGAFDYRVVMPPVASLQDAFRKLRELKSRNIDSYVITQGPNARGISLGVFSSQAGAERHLSWLAGEGYEAAIKSIARVSRAYWIYRNGQDDFPPGQLATAQADFSVIKVTKAPCLN